MKFDTSLLLNLFAAAAMLVMGFRSFSKKHQMKFSDDEERAMWEKKFGVFYFFNAVVFAASPFLPHTSIGGSRLLSIGIAADTVFLLMYHAWKKAGKTTEPFQKALHLLHFSATMEKTQEVFFMVKHIILWQLKDELSAAEKAEIKANIKTGLEGLAGQIPGLVEVHVNINGLPSSNADLMLDTTFTDAAALKGYSTHPAHMAVADGKVRPYTKTRVCLDFEV